MNLTAMPIQANRRFFSVIFRAVFLQVHDHCLKPQEPVAELAADSGFFIQGGKQMMACLVRETANDLRAQDTDTG